MFNMSDHIPFDDHMPHDMFFGHSQSSQGSVDGNRGKPLDAHNFRETLIVAHPVAPY